MVTPAVSVNYSIPYIDNLWPEGRVYYDIMHVTDVHRRDIFHYEFLRLQVQLEEKTCLRFMRRRWKTKRSLLIGNLTYQPRGAVAYGDFSYALGTGPYYSYISHLLEGLGLEYEMKRKDRDKYIQIDWKYFGHPQNTRYNKTDKWPPEGVEYPPYSLRTAMHNSYDVRNTKVRWDPRIRLLCGDKHKTYSSEWDIGFDIDRINAVYNLLANDIKENITTCDPDSPTTLKHETIIRPATHVCKSPGLKMHYEDLSC